MTTRQLILKIHQEIREGHQKIAIRHATEEMLEVIEKHFDVEAAYFEPPDDTLHIVVREKQA